MKKVLSLILVILLLTSISFAYADPGHEKPINSTAEKVKDEKPRNPKAEKMKTEKEKKEKEKKEKEEEVKNKPAKELSEIEQQLLDLKNDFKINHSDKQKRKEILQQIHECKKIRNEAKIGVFVEGEEVEFDVPPVIKEGRVLVPVRAVANSLKADDVQWNQEEKTVTIIKGEKIVILKIDSNIAIVDGEEVIIDAKAELQNNRTIVPLRFLMEVFDKNVEWDDDSETVIIEDPEEDEDDTDEETDEEAEEDEDDIDDETEQEDELDEEDGAENE
ncbi:MAG TPA: copper amine oxidase N-terminal domain-containing protein [Thermoanaerobacterales bacterium]|nr:copper amine oxidase N-terminal domain-containing protein [Thermoanaerobacterales bacterium]